MQTYAVFCRDLSDPHSTTWIENIDAGTVAQAIELARARCAECWDYHPTEVSVIGVLLAPIDILEWDDEGL